MFEFIGGLLELSPEDLVVFRNVADRQSPPIAGNETKSSDRVFRKVAALECKRLGSGIQFKEVYCRHCVQKSSYRVDLGRVLAMSRRCDGG